MHRNILCTKLKSLAEGLDNLITKIRSTENLFISMIVELFETGSSMERKRKNYDNVLATKSRRISGEVIDEIQRENNCDVAGNNGPVGGIGCQLDRQP